MKSINKILLLLSLVCFVSCEKEPELMYEEKITEVNILDATAEIVSHNIRFTVTYDFLISESYSHSMVSLRLKYGTDSSVKYYIPVELRLTDIINGYGYCGVAVTDVINRYSGELYYQVELVCDELVISSSEVKKLELQ